MGNGLDELGKKAKTANMRANNPAAPAGLSQKGLEAYEAGSRAQDQRFAKGEVEAGRMSAADAGQWYTGANKLSTTNGWDNDFVKKWEKGWTKALKAGEADNYFDRGTGVVTWDHETKSGKSFAWGDVVEDGEVKGNIFKDYDKQTAALLMAPWVVSGKEQGEAFQKALNNDDPNVVAELVEKYHKAGAKLWKDHAAGVKFAADTEKTAEDIDGWASVVNVFAGIGGGAAVGSAFGPWGALGGGIAGGVGAFLNRDELVEREARLWEMTKLSNRENNTIAAAGTLVNQVGGLSAKFMSPASNIVHGSYDALNEEWGDNKAGFYATDEKGKRKAGLGWRGTDLAATLVDMTGQFGSKAGADIFMANMGMQIGGEVTEMLASGGKSFNANIASYQKVYVDDEGNFSPLRAAAGVGYIGIDVLQMGMGRGLTRAVDMKRKFVGEGKAYSDEIRWLADKRPMALGGEKGMVEQAEKYAEKFNQRLKDAGKTEGFIKYDPKNLKRVEAGGWKFTQDVSTGRIVPGSGRMTVAVLAPSETVQSVNARRRAIKIAEQRRGAVDADDFYNALMDTAYQKGTSHMLVNGIAEGYEEGLQEILGSMRFGDRLDMGQIMESGLYGFFSGMGMAAGTMYNAPNESDRLFTLRQMASDLDPTLRKFTREEWTKLSRFEQRREAARSKISDQMVKEAFEKAADRLAAADNESIAAIHKVRDAMEQVKSSELKSGVDFSIGRHQISLMESGGEVDEHGELLSGERPNYSTETGFQQTVLDFALHARGMAESAEQYQKELADLTERMNKLPELQQQIAYMRAEVKNAKNRKASKAELRDLNAELDSLLRAEENMLDLQDRYDEVEQRFARLSDVLKWSREVDASVIDSLGSLVQKESAKGDKADWAVVSAEITLANQRLYNLFHGLEPEFRRADGSTIKLTSEDILAIQRYVTHNWARDPQDHDGTYQAMLPQISSVLTEHNSSARRMGDVILQAKGADFDGDKDALLATMILGDKGFAKVRSGGNLVGTGRSVNIGVPKYEKHNIAMLCEALKTGTQTQKVMAEAQIERIKAAFKWRYIEEPQQRKPPVEPFLEVELIDEVFRRFKEAVLSNDGKARLQLVDGLAEAASGVIQAKGEAELRNEWAWMDEVIVANLQAFQTRYVSARGTWGSLSGEITKKDTEKRTRKFKNLRERKMRKASTLGFDMSVRSAAVSVFRGIQQLHYSVTNAAVESAEWKQNIPVEELQAIYRAMSKQVTDSELYQTMTGDTIIDLSYAMLKAAAYDLMKEHPEIKAAESFAVIANTAVEEIVRVAVEDPGTGETTYEYVKSGKTITIAQAILKHNIYSEMDKNQNVLGINDKLVNNYKRLLALTEPNKQGHGDKSKVNAQAAFIEIVKSRQLYELLGEDAPSFGPQMTVGQFLRIYRNMSPENRRNLKYEFEADVAYLGREETQDMPYMWHEVFPKNGEAQVSSYRSVVDSLLAYGNVELSMKEDGTVTGWMAAKDAAAHKEFRNGFKSIRSILKETLVVEGRDRKDFNSDDPKVRARVIRKMVQQNQKLDRVILDLIPDHIVAAAFTFHSDGRVSPPDWVYSMLSEKTAERAELIMWDALVWTEFNALQEFDKESGAIESTIQYKKLKKRSHRLIYRLKLSGQEDLLRNMRVAVEKMPSLDAYMKWLNTEANVRLFEEAPYLAWVDDVAEFDVEPGSDVWSPNMSGADMLQAIRDFQDKTAEIDRDISKKLLRREANNKVKRKIRDALKYEAGDKSVNLSPDAMDLLRKGRMAVDQAKHFKVSVGPMAVFNAAFHAALGMAAKGHVKGETPAYLDAQAALEASFEAFGWLVNYERLRDALTSVNLEDVAQNLNQVMRGAGRSMDADGNIVEWKDYKLEDILDLMDDPRTEDFAIGLMFPQAVEIGEDGIPRVQHMTEGLLTNLFEFNTYNEFFPSDGNAQRDGYKAAKALSLLEGLAKNYNNIYEVQAELQTWVVSRLSGADHALSVREIEDLTAEAIIDFFETARVFGQYTARHPQEKDSRGVATGRNPLEVLGEKLKESRQKAVYKALGGEIDFESRLDPEEWVTLAGMIGQAAQEEYDENVKRINAWLKEEDSDEAAEEALRREAIEAAQLERTMSRLKSPEFKDEVKVAEDLYSLEGEPEDIQNMKRVVILKFLANNMSSLYRVPEALLELDAAYELIEEAKGAENLDEADEKLEDLSWGVLSRVAISMHLDKKTGLGSAGGKIPLFPDASQNDRKRFWDKSMSYMLDKFIDPNSAIMQAMATMLAQSGRLDGAVVTEADVTKLVEERVFNPKTVGAWTPETYSRIIEARERIVSAPAKPAIEMSGSSPKRVTPMNMAGRRTDKVPEDSMLAKATLDWNFLKNNSDSARFETSVPYATDSKQGRRPEYSEKIELNNRVAKSVKLRAVNKKGQRVTYELLGGRSLVGYGYQSDAARLADGYYVIHPERILKEVERRQIRHGLDIGSIQVDIEYFHPESQPAKEEWYNNVYYEGTSFYLKADDFESLNATLWFANGSISPGTQAMAMEAAKLGMPAIVKIGMPTLDEVKQLEADWEVGFSRMLRSKARWLLEQDLGSAKPDEENQLDQEYYNAVVKEMKMRHFVRGKNAKGKIEVWTAEQAIQHQLVNGTAIPLKDAELYIPTTRVLNSLWGEQGKQGIKRLNLVKEVQPEKIVRWRGDTRALTREFRGARVQKTVQLEDTVVASMSKATVMQPRSLHVRTARSLMEQKVENFQRAASVVHTSRGRLTTEGERGFDAGRGLKKVLKQAKKWNKASDMRVMWQTFGLPFPPRSEDAVVLAELAMQELEKTGQQSSKFKTGWIYQHNGVHSPYDYMLSKESNKKEKSGSAFDVTYGDVVVIDLASFDGKNVEKQVRDVMEWLAGKGAVIVLSGSKSVSELKSDVSTDEVLDALGYRRKLGAADVYELDERDLLYQNERARLSYDMETRGINARNVRTIAYARGLRFQENVVGIIGQDGLRGDIAVSGNMVPTNAFKDLNLPADSLTKKSQLMTVVKRLQGLENKRKELRRLRKTATSNIKDQEKRVEAEKEFDEKFHEMMERIKKNNGKVVPQEGDFFGKGSMIPLVNSMGEIYLYRHGYKVDTDDIAEQFTTNLKKRGTSGFAVARTKRDKNQKVYSGIVSKVQPDERFGLKIELRIPMSELGNKEQIEGGGMKFVTVELPSNIVFPDLDLTVDGRRVDWMTDADSTLAKEAFEGWITNFRNAWAYFGPPDILGHVTAALLGEDYRNDKESRNTTEEILEAIAKYSEKIELEELEVYREIGGFGSRQIADFHEAMKLVDIGYEVDFESINSEDVDGQIAFAVISYLMVRGARTEHILQNTGALSDMESLDENEVRLMPWAFTSFFDQAQIGSPLKTYLFDQINSRLQKEETPGKYAEGNPLYKGFYMNQLWEVEVHTGDPDNRYKVRLQFAEVHASGDNADIERMVFEEDNKGNYSQHYANIAYGAVGGEMLLTEDAKKLRAFLDQEGIRKFKKGDKDRVSTFWSMLDKVDMNTRLREAWQVRSPAEVVQLRRMQEWMGQFRARIEFDPERGWDGEEFSQEKYEMRAREALAIVKADARYINIIDNFVRQVTGVWKGPDKDGVVRDPLTAAEAMEALELIIQNLKQGYLPVMDGVVPQIHIDDLRILFKENEDEENPWRPKMAKDRSSTRVAKNWEDWVDVALGTADFNENGFDTMYQVALDGFTQTFVGAVDGLSELKVSRNDLVNAKLMDPEFNRAVVSRNPDLDIAALEPAMLDKMLPTMEDLMEGNLKGHVTGRNLPPSSSRLKRIKKRLHYRIENKMPIPVERTLTDIGERGHAYRTYGQNGSELLKILIDLRLVTSLANPVLWLSAGPEQLFRGMIDRYTDVLRGTAYTGFTAKKQAEASGALTSVASEAAEKVRQAGGKPVKLGAKGRTAYELVEKFGLQTRYSVNELNVLSNMIDALSVHDMKQMLQKELGFGSGDPLPNAGKFRRGLNKAANWAGKFQDPTIGVPEKTLIRRYMDGVLDYVFDNGLDSNISLQNLAGIMKQDPSYVKKHFPDAHNAGMRRVENARSLKLTTLGAFVKWTYEPASNSSRAGITYFGTLVGKIPMMFSTYSTNVITTILGLQGVDAFIATSLHGRNKGIFGAAENWVRGGDPGYDPTKDKIDMSAVIDGCDISRAFIQGGVTHSGLFLMGMLAGGFGLSGEDEEAKLRRKLENAQGVLHMYNPLDPANSFLNADMVFVDKLPGWLNFVKYLMPRNEDGSTREYGEMHWVLKQFLAPIIGMEKFYETGEFGHVIHGFEEAIGSYPLINQSMYWQTTETAKMLLSEAKLAEEEGSREGSMKSLKLLMTVVGVYESMLFESSFVNQIYVGKDAFDRDPYTQPKRDNASKDGFARDSRGNVRQNDTALIDYWNPETERFEQGYQKEDGFKTELKVMTENKFTLALVSTLMNFQTLGSSEYLRENMPVKMRSQDLMELTPEQAKAHIKLQMVLDILSGKQKDMTNVTAKEIEYEVRQRMYALGRATGHFYTNNEISAIAEEEAASAGSFYKSLMKGMTEEDFATEQAKAIFKGLLNNTITEGDLAVQGISIPYEQRDKIVSDWTKELVQEGLDMGLDKKAAEYRARRFMSGPYDRPDIDGLQDLLYSDKISAAKSVKYAQLNSPYAIGPDGFPWAVGTSRGGNFVSAALRALGVMPIAGQIIPDNDSIGVDALNNVYNKVTNQNTGMRAIIPVNETENLLTNEEIGARAERAIKAALRENFTKNNAFDTEADEATAKSYGKRGYYRRYGGGYRRSRGGGYSGSGGAYFVKQQAMPRTMSVYGNTMPFVNTSNPIIRRADIRRERVWSERGRLSQWQ